MRRSAIAAVWIVGCGARTGLDVPADASPDVHVVDASHDAPVDVSPDVPPPPPPPPPATCPFTKQTELAMVADAPVDFILLDATFVYFHTQGGIWRVPKSGGTAKELAITGPADWPVWSFFTVDATSITWASLDSSATDSLVATAPIGGGPATTITTLPGRFMAILDGSQRFVWQPDYVDGLLDVISGTTATTIAKLPEGTLELAEHGASLYGASSKGVFRLDGTTTKFLSTMPSGALAMDDANVYFTQSETSGVTTSAVYRVDILGAKSAVPISAADTDLLGGIAIAGDYVYVTRRSGSVMRVDKNGQTSATIGTFDGQIMDIATDGACVYFTSTEEDVFANSHVFVAPL
jgi:hypothetical protein